MSKINSKGFILGALLGFLVVILGSIHLLTPYCFLRPSIWPPETPSYCQGFLSYFGLPILFILIPIIWVGVPESIAFILSPALLVLLSGLLGKGIQKILFSR